MTAPHQSLGVLSRRHLGSSSFAFVLAVLLLFATLFLNPWLLVPRTLALSLGTFAPFAIAAMASTPAIVSGGGGIDISIGPLMALIGIIFVKYLLPSELPPENRTETEATI